MYNKLYGFSEKPFEVNHDPRFLYLTPSHRNALDSMIDADQDRRVYLYHGEVTGKTTLVYSMLGHLDKKVKTVYYRSLDVSFQRITENHSPKVKSGGYRGK